MKINVCPRCLQPGSLVVDERPYNTYIYVVHSDGKKKRKCYLGPETYKYVTATHYRDGLVLKGMRDPLRIGEYLIRVIERLSKMVPYGDEEDRRAFEELRWETMLDAFRRTANAVYELAKGDTTKCLQVFRIIEELEEALKRCLEGIPTSSR